MNDKQIESVAMATIPTGWAGYIVTHLQQVNEAVQIGSGLLAGGASLAGLLYYGLKWIRLLREKRNA